MELLIGGDCAYIGYKADGTKVIIYGQSGKNAWGYDNEGYDKDGYDVKGYDKDGYDRSGYNKDGYDKDGYNRAGYDKKGCKKGEKPLPINKKNYNFPNVTHLNIYCKNSNLNLSKLKFLKYVYIRTSTKKTFTLNAPCAKYVKVHGGCKMNLSSCKRAEVIDAGNCILPKKAKNLKSLTLDGMKRTKLDASGYPNLRELLFYGYKSPLKSVKLTKCRKLTYLYFYACRNILSVDARKCKLKAVDVCGCDKIKSVSKIKVNSGAKKSIDKGRWWERTSAYKKRSWDVRNYS